MFITGRIHEVFELSRAADYDHYPYSIDFIEEVPLFHTVIIPLHPLPGKGTIRGVAE